MKVGVSLMILAMATSVVTGHAQVVTTQFGAIQGSRTGAVYEFLGIPFASPPVDSLRWRAPRDPDPWPDTLLASDYPPACPQKRYEQGSTEFTLEGNEDCLYLNIWTPQTGQANLPVLVFIHGGGNQQGSAGEIQGGTRIYFGGHMAERGNVVVVTIQYRLGPLGFLVHPGLEQENGRRISGNYAVLDQLLALTWIRTNIDAFGGDPRKVMIFGESAGGVNVGNLIVSPLASGLFQRACIQSAAPVLNDYADAKKKGMAFVDSLITDGSDEQKIDWLRNLPADSLITSLSSPIVAGKIQMNWPPVVDQYVFTDFPMVSLRKGAFNRVPLLIGSNSEEMSLSVPLTVTPAMVSALINLSLPAAWRPEALQLYPPGSTAAEARESYVNLLTDAQFTVSVRRTAQCMEVNQIEPVWRYFFTHRHTVPLLSGLGSYHGMELFYVFNTWEDATLGSGVFFHAQDDSVQQDMLGYWVNFATTGNPNGPGRVIWPEFSAETDDYLEIKSTPEAGKYGVRTAESDFWDRVTGFTGCLGPESIDAVETRSEFIVFPNPTEGKVRILTRHTNEPLTISLVDILGRILVPGFIGSEMDLTDYPPGLYFLIINSKDVFQKLPVIRR